MSAQAGHGDNRSIEEGLRRGLPPGPSEPAVRRFREGAEGLVDVRYATVDSPVGSLLVAASARGLVRIDFRGEGALEEVASDVSPRILRGALDGERRELDEYFAGRRRGFDVGVDWSVVRGFTRRVLRQTARLGYGETASYGEVARRAGSPRAARAAGNALGSNPVPIVVPCHRVVHADGGLGGYGGGLDRKRFLLELEGAGAEG